jgi:hypothetical protein
LTIEEHSQRRGGSKKELGSIETFDIWLESQEKAWKPKKAVRTASELLGMPKDTMEEWLGRQKAIERVKRPEITLPLGSHEVWIRQQVSNRILEEMSEETVVA